MHLRALDGHLRELECSDATAALQLTHPTRLEAPSGTRHVLSGGLAADAAGLYLLSVAGVHLVRA